MSPPSSPRVPKILANPSPEFAEIVGLMLGDGNIYLNKKFSIYLIRVFGDSVTDRRYLLDFVSSIFKRTFGVEMGSRGAKGSRELILYKQSKDLLFTFKSHGILPGNKKKNNIGVPDWIMENREFKKSCIRGLVDTDGSVYPKTKDHKVPTIWFKSAIPSLREDFRRILLDLGFHPTKWSKASSQFKGAGDIAQCSLGKSEEVIRYYKEIGFSNPKHLERFIRFWS